MLPHLGISLSPILLLLLQRKYREQLVELVLSFLFTALLPHVQDKVAESFIS